MPNGTYIRKHEAQVKTQRNPGHSPPVGQKQPLGFGQVPYLCLWEFSSAACFRICTPNLPPLNQPRSIFPESECSTLTNPLLCRKGLECVSSIFHLQAPLGSPRGPLCLPRALKLSVQHPRDLTAADPTLQSRGGGGWVSGCGERRLYLRQPEGPRQGWGSPPLSPRPLSRPWERLGPPGRKAPPFPVAYSWPRPWTAAGRLEEEGTKTDRGNSLPGSAPRGARARDGGDRRAQVSPGWADLGETS